MAISASYFTPFQLFFYSICIMGIEAPVLRPKSGCENAMEGGTLGREEGKKKSGTAVTW
jgi:hypothetical protein